VRNKQLIRSAALSADGAVVYDASARNQAPRLLARLAHGRIESATGELPDWFLALYGDLFR